MSLTLQIPEEVEAAIRSEAKKRGTTPEPLAAKTLTDQFAHPSASPQRYPLTRSFRPLSAGSIANK